MSTTHSFRVPLDIWRRVLRFVPAVEVETGGRGRRKSPERIVCERAIGLGVLFVSEADLVSERARRGNTPAVVNLSGNLLAAVRAVGEPDAAVVRAALARGLDMMGVPG